MIYKIETANDVWVVDARNPTEAIQKAFTEHLPKAIGYLVEVQPEDGETLYIGGERAAKLAGLVGEEG